MSAPAKLDGVITEAAFQRTIINYAELTGWRVMHVHPQTNRVGATRTATTVKGWPDLTFWRGEKFLMVELKSERGRLSAEQSEVLAELLVAGVDVRVWRPSSWPEIEDTLR